MQVAVRDRVHIYIFGVGTWPSENKKRRAGKAPAVAEEGGFRAIRSGSEHRLCTSTNRSANWRVVGGTWHRRSRRPFR
jgi:hypothetical protein